MMRRELVLIAILTAGCTKTSEKYCAMHPEDVENCGGGSGDGGTACTTDPQCAAIDETRPVCEAETCVECTEEKQERCALIGHICEGTACRPCESHLECASGVCKADGACAAPEDVAYVTTNGNGDCMTMQTPCNDLVEAEGTDRPVIRVMGNITSSNVTVFQDGATEIYGVGAAVLTRSNSGNIIDLDNTGTSLALHDLRITGADNGHAIESSQGVPELRVVRTIIDRNDGAAVRFPDGGKVTISRSVIARNASDLSSGLVLLNVELVVTNTIIALNGNTSALVGGAALGPTGQSVFEFNTVFGNISQGTQPYTGITCMGDVALRNNIIYQNDTNSCMTILYSLLDSNGPAGNNNLIGMNPMLRGVTAEAIDPMFMRLTPNSPARDAGDPNATATEDIDGDARPAGNQSDIGADEVAP